MKKITMIKMQGCPYCAKAAQAVEELRAEQPAYAGVEIEIIDENEQPELAKQYGVKQAPTLVLPDGTKIAGAGAIKAYMSQIA